MENKFLLTDDLLWDYADGFLAAPDNTRVEAYLQQHPEWQARLRSILDEKQLLATMPLESPDPGFTDRVMAAWTAEQTQAKSAKGSKDWIIRLIVLAFGLFVITPVIVMLVAALQMAPAELPTVPMPELPAIDWTTLAASPILTYGLLLLFAVSVLRLLDKILQHQRLAHKLA